MVDADFAAPLELTEPELGELEAVLDEDESEEEEDEGIAGDDDEEVDRESLR